MIRAITAQDAPSVHAIITQSLGYDCELSVVERRIVALSADERCISLVHEDEETGEVDGFIHALRYDTLHSEGGWDVISLAVAPQAQGRGVGRRLLAACEQEVLRRGGSYVRLNSRVARTKAHGFYEHVGYVCDKLQKRFIRKLGDR